MRYLTQEQINKLKDDGFLLIKRVFSKEEILEMKKVASNFCSLNNYDTVIGDALSLKGMAEYVLDDRLVSIAKDVLGDEIIYFGDSALHCKPNNRIFHNDARGDKWDPSNSDYPLYRMGFFFQDHYSHSGGIKFRAGSHKKVLYYSKFFKTLTISIFKILIGKLSIKALFNTGEIVNAKSEIGDVVIWNLRTEHSGGAVILKDSPDKGLLPHQDDKISDNQKLPEHDARMAVFSCFAAPHEATESYISWKVNNAGYKGHWLASPFDKPEIRNLAEKKAVTLDFRGIKKYRELSELC
jgi:hypothetical protein